ncbi:MAG: LysE family translocator [Devosiaceae bacterium]|nr:LysE family translocator [Devosiaceae bacterium MH13]
MTFLALLLFAGIYAAAVASPGPAVLALIARVLSRGTKGVAGFIAGCAIGDLIWFALAVGGLAVVAQTMQGVFTAIKWAGIAYLLYLAYKLWTAPAQADATKARSLRGETNGAMLLAGLSLTLSNPKTMVFFLAILPTVVDLPTLSLLGAFEIGAVIAVLLPAILAIYALIFDRARGAVVGRFGMSRINKACAVGLAGAAGLVATR